MDRNIILRNLLELSRPLDEILQDLARHCWDSEVANMTLAGDHLAAIVLRFLSGDLDRESMESWANAIESRDDIAYDPNSRLGGVLHELANPLLFKPLTAERAEKLIGQCQTTPEG